MAIDPKTPVLIGTAALNRRELDPSRSSEASALMAEAARIALLDTGIGDTGIGDAGMGGGSRASRLAPELDWIVAMASMSGYADPAALVAAELDAPEATTVLAEIGILQTTPIARIAEAMRAGDINMALLVGGEAKFRSLRSQITGVDAPVTVQPEGTSPGLHWAPSGDIISKHEIAAGMVTAVEHYAMLENARRAAAGRSIDDHHRHVAELYAGFNAVAQANPTAAFPEPKSADFLATPSDKNRPLAFPYWKWHNSQWNVDQAAALVFCTAERADELGVAPERRAYPTAIVESNEMVPVGERFDVARDEGFTAIAAELAAVGIDAADIDFLELYSCFPAAVQAQIDAFGLSGGGPFTVTGGMAFAGGPLNNFVLQGLVALTGRMRSKQHNLHEQLQGPAQTALATAVSGMLTKQGAVTWSTEAPAAGCAVRDVSAVVAARPRASLVEARAGIGTVVTYTVRYGDQNEPAAVVALLDAGGQRSIAVIDDPGLAKYCTEVEAIGLRMEVTGSGGAHVLD